MRGKKIFNPKEFHEFSLEKVVPKNHLLRRLDSLLDLGFIDRMTEGLYGYNGNKSVDPVVVIKVLLLGFLYNIGSVRETMRQIEDRLSFRWYIRYDLDEAIPDHSAISKNLKRFGSELFQELFERIVQQCIDNGLVEAKMVHLDSSNIKADASLKSVKHNRPKDIFHPDIAPKSYWDKVHEEMKKTIPNVNDRMSSTTDPDASILSRDGDKLGLYYKDHRAVDDKLGVILVTHATSGDVTDEQQLKPLVDDLIFEKQVTPQRIAADKKYGNVKNYKELINKGIESNIPHADPPTRKGIFNKNKFSYDPATDNYICPAGETMYSQSGSDVKKRHFRASGSACAVCAMRSRCTTGKGPRTIYRHADENYVDQALAKCNTPQFHHNMGRRMAVIEGRFGNAKEYYAHRRSRWRGLIKMQIQCYLVATVQNLKKLLNYGGRTGNNAANQAIPLIIDLFVAVFSLPDNVSWTIKDQNTKNKQILNFHTSKNNLKLESIS